MQKDNYSSWSQKYASYRLIITFELMLFLASLLILLTTDTRINFSFANIEALVVGIVAAVLLGVVFSYLIKKYKPLNDLVVWMYPKSIRTGGFMVIVVARLIAIAEELFFRGVMLSQISLIPATMVFSLYHTKVNYKSLLLVPTAFILGLIFAFSYFLTDNIGIPILLHFIVVYLAIRLTRGSNLPI